MARGKYPDILLADARERHQQARTVVPRVPPHDRAEAGEAGIKGAGGA